MQSIRISAFIIFCSLLLGSISTVQAVSLLPERTTDVALTHKAPNYAACYEWVINRKPMANQTANPKHVTKSLAQKQAECVAWRSQSTAGLHKKWQNEMKQRVLRFRPRSDIRGVNKHFKILKWYPILAKIKNRFPTLNY